ncbi:hypothetical protein C5167_031694 [Papaver somniferum]|uniref:Legumain prodomain domain-containing protein n=1 Tax=Papaver somniferum TaxID=3469 RepID=A0A4Y7K8Z8_PAPSO|nr:vacuolar-processing enzyme-like [Papaver somniferum]RZC68478.1 hypothetical protein C5167_031694 [Papaver somniferum]
MNLYSFFSTLLILHLAVLIPTLICVESRNVGLKEFISRDDDKTSQGTRWAVLLAGSNGYENYRHQADICHAYQVLKKGGLKDENIIVFMYDDIVFNEYNPRPGVIINNPRGEDVYYGVPKDYIGNDVNVGNFLNVLLGNKSALTGNGSGKVVSSGPKDTIFIYYADHGAAGLLGMPGTSEALYANELHDTLKRKYKAGTYKSMVIYIEACEAGSMFEGLLKPGMNIYVTTASNASESSWGYYCPEDVPPSPSEYTTCLGDLYSIAWLEDSEKYNMKTESLYKQYGVVRRRTIAQNTNPGSHVTQYGDIKQLKNLCMYTYIGTNPENDEYKSSTKTNSKPVQMLSHSINQIDTDLIHFRLQYQKAPEGSKKKTTAWRKYKNAMQQRKYVDGSMDLVGKFLFGTAAKASNVIKAVRPAGQPLVDDWICYKAMVETYEKHCGPFSRYGFKHMRSLANMCNVGVKPDKMADASNYACTTLRKGSLQH